MRQPPFSWPRRHLCFFWLFQLAIVRLIRYHLTREPAGNDEMKKPGGNFICLSPLTWSYWADPSGWTRWKKHNFSNSTEASVKRTRFLSGWPIAFFVAYLRPLAYDGVALNSCVVPPPEFCLSNIFACLFSLVLLNFEATGLMEVTINKKTTKMNTCRWKHSTSTLQSQKEPQIKKEDPYTQSMR